MNEERTQMVNSINPSTEHDITMSSVININKYLNFFFLISIALEWTLKVQKSTLIGRPKNRDVNELIISVDIMIYLVDPKNCSTYIINWH
jgi:hypothetical protein